MANTLTTTYKFTQPEVGGADDQWGDLLNANWGKIDTLLQAGSNTETGFTGGSAAVLGTELQINGPAPGITFIESDATPPAGRYLMRGYNTGDFHFARYTDSPMTTLVDVWRYNAATGNFIIDKPLVTSGGITAGAAGDQTVLGRLEHVLNGSYMYIGALNSGVGAGYTRLYTDYSGSRLVMTMVDAAKSITKPIGITAANWYIDPAGFTLFGSCRVNASPAGAAQDGRFSTVTGTDMSLATGGTVINLRNSTTQLATVEAPGTSVPNLTSVITREKGDARYAPHTALLEALNTIAALTAKISEQDARITALEGANA